MEESKFKYLKSACLTGHFKNDWLLFLLNTGQLSVAQYFNIIFSKEEKRADARR